MKIKHLYISIILFCVLYAFTFVLSRDNNDVSNQVIKPKIGLVVNKPLKQADSNDNKPFIKDNKPAIARDSDIDNAPLPLLESEEDEQQEVVDVGEFIDIDADPIPQDDAEEIDIGEYIDVDAEPISQDDAVIEIGEFVDVDAEPISQDSEVIEIGEFIDVDADPIPQDDTEDIDIGEFIDVEHRNR